MCSPVRRRNARAGADGGEAVSVPSHRRDDKHKTRGTAAQRIPDRSSRGLLKSSLTLGFVNPDIASSEQRRHREHCKGLGELFGRRGTESVTITSSMPRLQSFDRYAGQHGVSRRDEHPLWRPASAARSRAWRSCAGRDDVLDHDTCRGPSRHLKRRSPPPHRRSNAAFVANRDRKRRGVGDRLCPASHRPRSGRRS